MSNNLTEVFLNQVMAILETYKKLQQQAKFDDLSDLSYEVAFDLLTRSKAVTERVTGKESAYSKQIDLIMSRTNSNDFDKLQMVIGVTESLRADLGSGYLASVSQLIHGEVFADFLEMGDHLLGEGYKDAAAVIAGSALEAHLRQLCGNNGIDTELTTPKGVQPKKADQMNADLAKANVYSKLDLKNVTAWLDLRNKAAHGHYTEYAKEQVSLLISGIRDFITRNPG